MQNLSEYLFQYIMEATYGKLYARADYQQARAAREAAGEALEATLTEEQRELLADFLAKNTAQSGFEEQHLFEETLSILPSLLFRS